MTRRRFVLSAAATGGVGTAVIVPLRGPATGLRVLSREERNVARAVAEVMFPADVLPVPGQDPRVIAEVDRILADTIDPIRAAGFRYVLRALQFGTIASRGTRFTALSPADRLDVMTTWGDPRVLPRRVAADSLKAVLGMAYFSLPDVLEAIGWRAGCGVGALEEGGA